MNIKFIETPDISNLDVEAIVIPANDELWISSEVGQLLLIKGGDQIEIEAMAQKPVVIGEAIITSSGKFDLIKYVIHAVTYGGTLWFPTLEAINQGTYNSLLIAYDYNIQSVALPLLGEPYTRATLEQIILSMRKGFQRFFKDYPNNKFKSIKFFNKDKAILNIFYKVFSS